MAASESAKKTPYHVKADHIEACNCQHGCNCQFEGFPNQGKCEFILGWHVRDGRFGDVSLKGVRAVVAAQISKSDPRRQRARRPVRR